MNGLVKIGTKATNSRAPKVGAKRTRTSARGTSVKLFRLDDDGSSVEVQPVRPKKKAKKTGGTRRRDLKKPKTFAPINPEDIISEHDSSEEESKHAPVSEDTPERVSSEGHNSSGDVHSSSEVPDDAFEGAVTRSRRKDYFSNDSPDRPYRRRHRSDESDDDTPQDSSQSHSGEFGRDPPGTPLSDSILTPVKMMTSRIRDSVPVDKFSRRSSKRSQKNIDIISTAVSLGVVCI